MSTKTYELLADALINAVAEKDLAEAKVLLETMTVLERASNGEKVTAPVRRKARRLPSRGGRLRGTNTITQRVLKALAKGPRNAVSVSKGVRAKIGTVSPALGRLERNGFVRVSNDSRPYEYELTKKGRKIVLALIRNKEESNG